VLADGAQFGVDGSKDGLQLGDGYCLLNVRGDLKARQAARYVGDEQVLQDSGNFSG
jgi:hypothetical protein